MDDLVKEVIPLLQYLIPGFFSAWIFYTLTAFKRPDTFGQIVQALIFTFVIHGAVVAVKKGMLWIGTWGWVLGVWDAAAEAAWSAFVAIALGLLACYLANNDGLHVWLRARGITKQTSYPSEWFSAFTNYQRFVVLHLVDERRLYGWPSVWPSEPSSGQFVIQEPSWLNDDGTEIPLAADCLTIDASRVQWVEFSEKTW
ncbi:DUF6338 family protein [Pseudomonas linyingensis]|uniref:DUF6338 family protein n=1 Tax=Pseudomonas linyingensis TaxID=915471 RepID=UPI000B802D9F|nr:DUF6338 family protein [Pseudomonas linyingensis]